MIVQTIQGIDCEYREIMPDEIILFSEFEKEEQYFRRTYHPFSESDLEAMVERTHQYTSEQAKWKELEEWRFDNGVYVTINGNIKFVPGSYYCYINYWYLEDGEHPDYREDERIFAIFLEYCCFKSPLYGVTRPKGRRQGATSFGAFFEWFIAGRKEFQNCGTVSFNDDAAADVFVNMIMPGFKSMLPCFQAEFDSPDDGKTFLRFTKPIEKKKRGTAAIKRQGLNSLIDFKSLTLNSYTNKRLSFLLLDEFGRWHKLNCNIYWSKVSKALRKGKKKRGFSYMPTVVNPKELGGENYKRFFEQSDQRKYGIKTPTGCVIFIMYGTQCYAGCIDKYGESVIDDPIEPIMGNDGEWITEGSKTLILRERALLTDKELMEHRRDFPIDEYDIFAFESGNCEFSAERLIARIEWLKENPVLLRQCRIIEEIKITKGIFPGQRDTKERIIKFMEDPTGNWLVYEMPQKDPNGKYFEVINDIYRVTNVHRYVVGADTIRIFDAENGSKATICVHKTSVGVGGEELGNYPVAFYVGRPKLPSQLYDEIIKVCLMYGCRANIERSAGDHFSEYFYKQGVDDLLLWTPARNPNAPMQKIGVGTETASPYQLAAQLECAKIYFDGTLIDGYNGNVHRIVFPQLLQQALEYNHSARTPFDLMVSFQMCLVAALKAPQIKVHQSRPKQLLPTYTIENFN